jgi:hypothetical protein
LGRGILGGPIREAAQQQGATAVGGRLDVPVTEADYRRVFVDLRREGVDPLYVPLTIEHLQFRQLIAALALEAKWPAVCAWRENAEAGALKRVGKPERSWTCHGWLCGLG